MGKFVLKVFRLNIDAFRKNILRSNH